MTSRTLSRSPHSRATTPPAQSITQTVATALQGNVTAFVSFNVPNVDPTQPGTLNEATVTFRFDVAVEPEANFTP